MAQHHDYWSRIVEQLLTFEGMPVLPPNSVPSFRQKHTGSMDLRLQLLELEEEVSDEIDISISAWPADPEPWTGLSELGLYFLRLRVESSLEFISSRLGDLDDSGRQMFRGLDDLPAVDFVRYILTDWWHSSGQKIAADRLIVKWHDAEVKRTASEQ